MSIIGDIISPVKGYLIAAAAAAVVGFGAWYTYRIAHDQHLADVNAAQTEVQKIERRNDKLEHDATVATLTAQQNFTTIVLDPPIPSIGLMCSAAPADPVPHAPASNSSGHDAALGPVGDPSGALLTIGRKYDAWIIQLQAENAALRHELEAAHK